MRRGALTIALFLLLGAVVNVGVAWACAANSYWDTAGLDARARDTTLTLVT